jgi:DNA gyrase subunit A
MTYTETICKELEEIINSESNPGIERFNDLTGEKPNLKIYLTKKANPDKILKFLYKNTSLQSYYGVNFTMLDNGRFPKLFTWKELLQAHIDHEKTIYRRGFEYDLRKLNERIFIIDGLLICLAKIEEVIQVIKGSSSSAAAALELQKQFLLDAVQAKAVLDMKLARLAHLEV